MYSLSDNLTVEIKQSIFSSESYLQLKKNNTYVNVSWSSWNKLKSYMSEISQALEEEKFFTRYLYKTFEDSQAVVIEKYKSKIYVGIHSFNEKDILQIDKGINMSQAEWQKWMGIRDQIDTNQKPPERGWSPEEWQNWMYMDTNQKPPERGCYKETKTPIFQWNRPISQWIYESSGTFKDSINKGVGKTRTQTMMTDPFNTS